MQDPGQGEAESDDAGARFRAYADGDIRPWPGEAPTAGKGRTRAKRVTATLKAVKELRPARTEIIICTGAAHPGRDAGLGRPRDLDVPRPQVQGLRRVLPGVRSARASAKFERSYPGLVPGGSDADAAFAIAT